MYESQPIEKSLFEKLKNTDFKPVIPEHVSVQTRGNACLVLDARKPDWFFCSKSFLPLMDKIDGERTISQLSQLAVNHLRLPSKEVEIFLKFVVDELFVIDIPDFDENLRLEGNMLDMVYIQVTSKCNLDCVYCYRDTRKALPGEMSTDEIKRIVLEIADLRPGITFVITGGEPTIRRDIVEICQFIKEKGFIIEMNTNGSFIHKHPQLIELVDRFNISLDGSTEEIHDSLRGKGTFLRTEKAIAYLQEHGANFVITPTYTAQNLHDMPTLFNKYHNIRTSFKNNVFMKMGKGKEEQQLAVSCRQLCETCKNLPKRINDENDIDFLPIKGQRKVSCGMGVAYLSIEANGNVYPCQLMHMDRFYMGNIRAKSLNNIYWESEIANECRGRNVNKYEGCKTCRIKYICGGGCRARSLYEQGSPDIADGLCEFWRKKYPESLWADAPTEILPLMQEETRELQILAQAESD